MKEASKHVVAKSGPPKGSIRINRLRRDFGFTDTQARLIDDLYYGGSDSVQ